MYAPFRRRFQFVTNGTVWVIKEKASVPARSGGSAADQHALERFSEETGPQEPSDRVFAGVDRQAEQTANLLTCEPYLRHFHLNHLNPGPHVFRDLRDPHTWLLRAHPYWDITPPQPKTNTLS